MAGHILRRFYGLAFFSPASWAVFVFRQSVLPPHLLLTEREYEERENWSERKEFHLRKPLIILAGLPHEAGFAILPYVRNRFYAFLFPAFHAPAPTAPTSITANAPGSGAPLGAPEPPPEPPPLPPPAEVVSTSPMLSHSSLP